MKSPITALARISKEFARKHPGKVEDVILFGSLRRGSRQPADIDLLILFPGKVDKDLEYEFRRKAEKIARNPSVLSIPSKEVLQNGFEAREGVLFEGYSLLSSKALASSYGFVPMGLFFTSSSSLSKKDLTRFYYALNGRGSSRGELHRLLGNKIADNALLFPLHTIELAKDFFSYWNLPFQFVPVLIPERLAKPGILGKIKL